MLSQPCTHQPNGDLLAAADGTLTARYACGSDLSESFASAGGIGGLLARSHGYSNGSEARFPSLSQIRLMLSERRLPASRQAV